MPNVLLKRYEKPSMWRRMSLANWRHPTDPQVYGRLEVDMTRALDFAHKESERTGARVTATHLVARAVAIALRRHPAANGIIRWNRIYERQNVDVFCQVAIPGEKPDLSGAVLRNVDLKRPGEIAMELAERSRLIREGKDGRVANARRSLDRMPDFLYRFVLGFLAILQYTLNLDLRVFGLPRDPFGGAMVTSVGSLGIAEGFAPLVPMSYSPLLVSVGKVRDRPVAVEGRVEVRPTCVLCAVFDHRMMDGVTAGLLTQAVEEYLSDPETFEAGRERPRA
jgi:pyruvate dehydrogenase E2 component (dihydrolipoamide acetyltransferase)